MVGETFLSGNNTGGALSAHCQVVGLATKPRSNPNFPSVTSLMIDRREESAPGSIRSQKNIESRAFEHIKTMSVNKQRCLIDTGGARWGVHMAGIRLHHSEISFHYSSSSKHYHTSCVYYPHISIGYRKHHWWPGDFNIPISMIRSASELRILTLKWSSTSTTSPERHE